MSHSGFKNHMPRQFHSFQSVLSSMHFHEVGQCILINFGLYSFMRKLMLRAAKQAKHTWYLSLFLRNRNLRPRNLTLESESKFATKLCVKFYTVCESVFSRSKWKILHLTRFLCTTRGCDCCAKYQVCCKAACFPLESLSVEEHR